MSDEAPVIALTAAPAAAGRFARNSAFGTLAGICTALGSVLGSVIVAHALGVERTGLVVYALWLAMVTAAIADFGVQPTLARYLPELIGAGNGDQAARLAATLRRPNAIAAGGALLIFIFYAVLYWRRPDSPLWLMVGLAAALQTLAGFTYGRLRGVQDFDQVALLTALSFASQLGGIAIGSSAFGTAGAVAGYCAGSILPALMTRRIRGSAVALPPDLRRRVGRYAVFAWASALSSSVVWSRAEVFFLQRSSGSAAVGLFSVGLTLANFAAQGPMLLTAALLPRFAQDYGKGALAEMRAAYAAVTRVLAFLVFPACLGMVAVLPSALPMVYGTAFAGAIPAATVLVIAGAVGAISSVGASLIMATDRSDFLFLSGLVAALLTVVAGVTVIPAFGLMGAVWARAVVQVAAVAIGAWFIIRRLHFPLPLWDLGKLLVAAILCAAAARLSLAAVPGILALPAAIAAGIVVYVAAVRSINGLPSSDIAWLRTLGSRLPAPLRRGVNLVLRLVEGNSRSHSKDFDAGASAASSVMTPVRGAPDAN